MTKELYVVDILVSVKYNKTLYCILRGRIKGLNSSITTILFEVGIYRIVVGQL